MAKKKIQLQGINNKQDVIPHNGIMDYDEGFIQARRKWLGAKTSVDLKYIGEYLEKGENLKGNIENFIGMSHIPLGVAGPIKIMGKHAKGEFYIPLATTEGALVMTYHRGMKILSKAGGVNVRILSDEMNITPGFKIKDLIDAEKLITWLNNNFESIKKEAEKTTKHGKLLKITPLISGRQVIVRFSYYTEDAQGLNMINKATQKACEYIESKTKRKYYLRSNYSSIKKAANNILHIGQGKSVFADVVLSKTALRMLGTTASEFEEYFKSTIFPSAQGGSLGNNAHFANAIAALFIACGQDVADVAISHIGTSFCEVVEDDSLYASIFIPNLSVGTIGGGTALGTQKECLEMIGCYGKGKVRKFAEIVGATVLAGEIAVLSALANRTYVNAHEKYGRNKPSK